MKSIREAIDSLQKSSCESKIELQNAQRVILDAIGNSKATREDIKAVVMNEFGKLMCPPTPHQASKLSYPTRKVKKKDTVVLSRNYDGLNEVGLIVEDYSPSYSAFYCDLDGQVSVEMGEFYHNIWEYLKHDLKKYKIKGKFSNKSRFFKSYLINKKVESNIENFINLLTTFCQKFDLKFEIVKDTSEAKMWFSKGSCRSLLSTQDYKEFGGDCD